MKTALIPPIPHLPHFGHGTFHLLLCHLLRRRYYRTHYHMQRQNGAYLVLDNSAHEKGEGEDAEKLAKWAVDMNVQEVVVPDVLFNVEQTIETCLRAHEIWYEGGSQMMKNLDPALMYVPQGKNLAEWVYCLRTLAQIHSYGARKHKIRRDFVIGISKDYEVWEGGLHFLLYKYIAPLRLAEMHAGVRVHVHLLGWGRNLWELGRLAYDFPWIRSTDSAKPFVFALNDVKLNAWTGKDPPEYPKRPKRYFDRRFTDPQLVLARSNVLTYQAIAQGTRIRVAS